MSLTDLIEQRHDHNRPLAVHVVGDPVDDEGQERSARALSQRIAHLVKRETGMVVGPDDTPHPVEPGDDLPDVVPSGSVLIIAVTDHKSLVRQRWRGLSELLAGMARPPELHVVIHAPELPAEIERLVDARAYPERDGESPSVSVLRYNPYEQAVYERDLEGLFGGGEAVAE